MNIPETILLVDDEVAIRNLYHIYFESHGFRVLCASSSSEALRILNREKIGVAIVDVVLGDDNGLDLLKEILSTRPGFPVIMISGKEARDEFFKEAVNIGATGVFSKTLPLSNLLNEVRSALQKTTGR